MTHFPFCPSHLSAQPQNSINILMFFWLPFRGFASELTGCGRVIHMPTDTRPIFKNKEIICLASRDTQMRWQLEREEHRNACFSLVLWKMFSLQFERSWNYFTSFRGISLHGERLSWTRNITCRAKSRRRCLSASAFSSAQHREWQSINRSVFLKSSRQFWRRSEKSESN